MDVKTKLALLEDMLEVDEGTLTAETELNDIDTWDSVAAISLLALVDEKFDKQLSSAEIRGFKTIEDVLKVMER